MMATTTKSSIRVKPFLFMIKSYYKLLITTRVKKISYDETYDGSVTTGHFQQLSLEIMK